MNDDILTAVYCEKCRCLDYRIFSGTRKDGTSFQNLECAECATYVCFVPLPITESRINDYLIPFGKYKGLKILDVYRDDPSYIVWMSVNLDKAPKEIAKKVLLEFGGEIGKTSQNNVRKN